MYVAPRPTEEDDPLFAVRLAIMPVAGFMIGMGLGSPLPMIYPTMMFSLLAANRKAFNPQRIFAAPIMFSVVLWIMSTLVVMLQGMPMLLVAVMSLIYFAAFYMIQRTGNSLGMLIAVGGVLMSIMGLGSYQAMDYLRAEMTKAALLSAVVIPLLYALLPPRTTQLAVDVYAPAHPDQHVMRAAIRTVVLLALSAYLYTILDSSNMMLAIGALFVLVFPTRRSVWQEAGQRSFSVILGGGLALGILALLTVSAHLTVLVCAVMLATLWLGQKMVTGRLPAMAYQDAASVMISLVGSALATSEPSFAFLQRATLTIVGAVLAAVATSLLEALLLKQPVEAAVR